MSGGDTAVTVLAFLLDGAVRSSAIGLAVAALLLVMRVESALARLVAWRFVLLATLAVFLLGPVTPRALHLPLPRPPAIAPVTVAPARADTRASEAAAALATASSTTPSDTAAPGPPTLWSWPIFMFAAYLAGVALLLARVFVGWRRYVAIERTAVPIADAGLSGAAPLFESGAVFVPMTAGLLHPAVILPVAWRTWPVAKLAIVLAHERSHVARRDGLTIALALAVRIVFWFNPLAWWLRRHVERLAEQASDAEVLASGADRSVYARTIVEFAMTVRRGHRAAWHPAIAGALPIERRVERILAWREDARASLTRNARVRIAATVGVTAFAIASLDARPRVDADVLPVSVAVTAVLGTRTITVPAPAATAKSHLAPRAMEPRRPRPAAQSSTPATKASAEPRVTFSGRWVPVDPNRAARLFEVGLSDVTALGMDVTQEAGTLTLTRLLTVALEHTLPFRNIAQRSVYNLDGRESPGGRNGDEVSTASWDGDALVIDTTTTRGTRRAVWTLAGSQLRIDTTIAMNNGVANTIVMVYRKAEAAGGDGLVTSRFAPAVVYPLSAPAPSILEKEVVCGLTLRHVTPDLDAKMIVQSDRPAGAAVRRIYSDACAAARR